MVERSHLLPCLQFIKAAEGGTLKGTMILDFSFVCCGTATFGVLYLMLHATIATCTRFE
jgi:hypothetical protein